MSDLNAKNFTLTVAKDIQKVLQTLRRIQKENSDIIQIVETSHLFYVHDISHPNFVFYVYNPVRDESDDETIFSLAYSPENEDSLATKKTQDWTANMELHFEDWIKLIREFNTISFTEEEIFSKFYEDEIYVDFEIVDEDSATHPFNNTQQTILYKFLSATVFYLEEKHPNDEAIKDICIETIALRDEIQNLTKKEFSKRFSKVLARIKKFSLKTFSDISDVAKKEIYKFLLHEGVKALPKWIDTIQTLFLPHN